MDRNDLEDVSAALELLRSAQHHAEPGSFRACDDTSQARGLLCGVLARNGVSTATAATRMTPEALEARRDRMIAQLEAGLAAGVSA